MKKLLALLLALCMVFSLVPTAFAAGNSQSESWTVQAEELPGYSSLRERVTENSAGSAVPEPKYGDDDIVTIIVQLEAPALLDYYGAAGTLAGGGVSAGAAVAQFISGAAALGDELLAGQKSVINAIGALGKTSAYSISSSTGVNVVAQWTTAINGFAVRVPYGQLDDIRALDGVKRAYVEHTYSVPEDQGSFGDTIGTAGASYDMVDVKDVWDAGYTGKGMLVAILDTGLDLWYTTWGDTTDLQTGIRRVHEAFTENSFKSDDAKDSLRYSEAQIDAKVASGALKATTLSAATTGYYKNAKVPYAFDYTGVTDEYGTVIMGDLDVYPGEGGSAHGTHVAGTVAGYAVTEEGEVTFSGVAPDAQLAIMKVFDDEGISNESSIINALEDALALGVDVINLSLGSDNGFSEDDTASGEVYAKVEAAGIIMMTSAGNSYYAGMNNSYGDHYPSTNPDSAMMSSPAVYDSNIAVAAINSTLQTNSYLKWSDGDAEHDAAYSDPYSVAIKYKFTSDYVGEGIEIIPVGGTGTWQDYYDAGFRSYYGYGEKGKTGIALVKRGEISFADKVSNAQSFAWSNYEQGQMVYGGVLAVIIYDGDPTATELINMSVDGTSLTSAFISGVDGAAIVAAVNEGKTVKLTEVEQNDRTTDWALGGQMSEFTSWGASPALELKPEITAPGGNIWSSVFDEGFSPADPSGKYDDYVGAYSMMSGTSMAAPHMSGITALVKQYVNTARFAEAAKAGGADDLTDLLLISTALPQQYNGTYYSPRVQGAGLVNAGAAVSTPAYITVDGQNIGKIELGDNVGSRFTLDFTVNNMSSSAVNYTARVVTLRPDTTEGDGTTLVIDSDVLISEVNAGSVSVPAGGSKSVSLSVDISSAVSQIESLFPNGTFIEGFVILTSDSVPQIGLPFLGFYGDWTAAPILDSAWWLDGCEEDEAESGYTLDSADPWADGDYTWYPSLLGYYDGYSFYNLGQNLADPASATGQTLYHRENVAISPNGDGFMDSVNDIEIYQMRDAKILVFEVRDAETGELYYKDGLAYLPRSFYSSDYGATVPYTAYYYMEWDGTDLSGNVLPDGTRCVYTVAAFGDGDYGEQIDYPGIDYPVTDFDSIDLSDPDTWPTFNGHAMDMTGDIYSFSVLIDTTAPKLQNNAITVTNDNGTLKMSGSVFEDGSLASVEIFPIATRTYTYNPSYGSETGVDLNSPFLAEYIYDPALHEFSFDVETVYEHVESYPGENYSYSYEWTGDVIISLTDYAGNERDYALRIQDMDEEGELLLSQTSALLHVGSEFDLSVINNTGSDANITRTSSDPGVATIDEFGHVVALAPGQTIITVTNGTSTAICVVVVVEYETEVLDFDLSIHHFEGLKAGNSEFTVKVVDLQPADVVIESMSWMTYEDEDYDEDWVGITSVEQNSSDGLQGNVFLNVSYYSDELIPAGSGYLEVTINGVSRRMTFTWEDIYQTSDEDDLISDAYPIDQTYYVSEGETADLIAKYKNSSAHSVLPVELWTAVGAENYSSNNPTDPAVGLILDGQPFAGTNVAWSGKIVAEPGYELPSSIRIFTRYDYGYEYEMQNYDWSTAYTYDPVTGEIYVAYTPYGATSSMVIRADGVESEGASGGTVSGETYERPEPIYGPFEWSFTEGLESAGGSMTTEENVYDRGDYKNVLHFTPNPGVSYITATSKEGYTVNFAVICEPTKAETLTLDVKNVEMAVGGSYTLTPTLDPKPTLDKDKEIIWTSYNPDVASIDENGVIFAYAEGYAYIFAQVRTNTAVNATCIVHVNGFSVFGGTDPDNDGKTTITIRNAVPGKTYYLVDDDGNVVGVGVADGSGNVTFEGLDPDTDYVLKTDPDDETGVVVHTPTLNGAENTESGVNNEKEELTLTSGSNTVTIKPVDGDKEYALMDPDTGEIVTEWLAGEDGGSLTFTGLDSGKTYTVVTREVGEDGTRSAMMELGSVTTTGTPSQEVTPPRPTTPQKPDTGTQTDSGVARLLNTEDHIAYMHGDTVGTFRPNGKITRAEMAQIFYNLLKNKNVTGSANFSDVSEGAWYYDAVIALANLGIINGYSDGSFLPNANITRAEAVTIAARFAKAIDGKVTFPDVTTTHWAYDSISTAVGYGWIQGDPEGTFRPEDSITRAEAAAIVGRMMARAADKSYADKHVSELKKFPDVSADHWAYYYIVEAANGHSYRTSNGQETWTGLK